MIFKFRKRPKHKTRTIKELIEAHVRDRNGFGVEAVSTACTGGTAFSDVELLTLDAALAIARESHIEVDVSHGVIRLLKEPSKLAAPLDGGISEIDKNYSKKLAKGSPVFAPVLSAVRRSLQTPLSLKSIGSNTIEIWTADSNDHVWSLSRLALLTGLTTTFGITFDFQRHTVVVRLITDAQADP